MTTEHEKPSADDKRKLRLYRHLLGIAINHYPEAPKAHTLFYEPPTRRQLLDLALEEGLVSYDEWHHAPACPANNWSRQCLPQGPCTCGAAARKIRMSNEQPSADDERAAPYPSPEAQMQVAAYKEQVRAEIRADELEVERDAARLALAERDAEIARLGLEKQAGDEIIFGLRQQVDELKAEIARLKPAPGYLSGKLNPFPERPPGADDEPDARYEEGLRKEIGDPRPDNPAWRPNQYHASDMAFLLRRLDAARLAQAQADLDAGAPTRRAMRGSSAPFSNSLRRSGTS